MDEQQQGGEKHNYQVKIARIVWEAVILEWSDEEANKLASPSIELCPHCGRNARISDQIYAAVVSDEAGNVVCEWSWWPRNAATRSAPVPGALQEAGDDL